MKWLPESTERAAAAHAELRGSGLVEPVAREDSELLLWQNHDIASFVEHRLGLHVDPLALDEALRSELIRRALDEYELARPYNGFTLPYWIRSGGERIGTVALAAVASGRSTLSLSSLYVHRGHRRRGHAQRVLNVTYRAAQAAGWLGIDLGASWCWQPAVRLYSKLAMWVGMWKRDLRLMWREDLPPWELEVAGDEARFCLRGRGKEAATPVIVARRCGTRLDWMEHELPLGMAEVGYLAPGTFALALALRGWPLITSDAAWQRQCAAGFSDCGGPEGLAFQIIRWEAWNRHRGFRLETPRIPGLDYRSWTELYPNEGAEG